MKNYLIIFLWTCIAAIANAQTPDIRIHTDIYAKDGPTNTFTLVIGAAPGKEGYADVVCSGGYQSEAEIVTAYYNEETGALIGTNVACQVDEKGIVEVFCDEGVVIDYFSCTGAEITSIEFKNPEALEILALEHNILESFDLTPFTNLQAVYLNDNPMSKGVLKDHGQKPELKVLEICQIGNIDPNFDITGYPNLVACDAMSTHGLTRLTASACPKLQKISIDNTSVSELDVTKNPELIILNISETRIARIDLSKNAKLQQLFATHSSAYNTDIKMSEIDVTHNPDLFYLFINDNNLTTLDVSKNAKLQDLYVRNNRLTSLDLSANTNLLNVFTSGNHMDFNTLPIPQDTWGDYDYTQRPLSIASSYQVGMPIDLSSHLVREGSETHAMLFQTNEADPFDITEIDPSLYTFADGILTVNAVIADSVYASFYNSLYPETELTTTRFVVKDSESYGKASLMAVITLPERSTKQVSMSVGMAGASEDNPKTFYVDMGDGTQQEFIATTQRTPAKANVTAEKSTQGQIKIYVPEGEVFTALKIADIKLSDIDLSKAVHLEELTLANTQLKALDLKWNRLLESIEITGNDFGADFTLAGVNGGYGKNVLSYINLSNNNMTEVKLNEPGSWQYIDLSHNKLSSVNFTDADYVKYLDVSHNEFEYLKINYLGELKTFYCNDNRLSELVMPETNVIETFNCANNNFTLASMPPRNGLDEAHFTYAPQCDIQIPSKGPGYNLSEYDVTIDGNATVFTWKTTDGRALVEGADYSIIDGTTRFNDNTIGQTLYCELTHAAYPAFSGDKVIKTSAMLSAGMPTHLLGTFTTTKGGQDVRVSLASTVPNNSIYIDWTGTNSLEQYSLATSYTVFAAKTTEGAKVKVWSYDENDNLSVFSLTNAKLADVDLSPMKNLIALTLSNSGISDMKWPESPNLRELSLDGCAFTSFDFTRYPNLNFVNFDDNKFQTLCLSGLDKIGTAAFANNYIKAITLSGNTSLWQLALAGNQLSYINLSGAPNIEQLYLNDNRLSSIDLSPLKNLRIIYLDNNRFDFSTLPVPQEQWALYTYGNQPELKIESVGGKVDLSSQAERDGVATEYTWYFGRPTFDYSTGILSGEELVVDEEYTIENGVTSFRTALDGVCCVLTNSLFPQTYLQTNLISTDADGIAPVSASRLTVSVNGRTITISGAQDGTTFSIYTASGTMIGSATASHGHATMSVPAAGMYVITAPGACTKLHVQ